MALDASIAGFLQVQAGKQTVFGTDVDPDFQLPVVGRYVDMQQVHTAEWDPGVWTKLTIVDVVGQFARFTLNGVLFYEMLPVLFNAGFDEMTPTGGGDGPHVYTGSAAPGAEGDPVPYTFRFGGNDSAGGAESAVEIRDAHMERLNLVHNLNVKAVLFESEWFGAFVDDDGGAGYALIAATVPFPLGMVNGLRSTLEIQDAGTTGGNFETMTAFACSLLDWQMSIDTGLRPAWSGDKNQLTYCGPRVEEPSCRFTPILRTSGTNYAITKTKADLRTYQELQLTFAGDDNRQAIFQMTGRWLPNFEAHDRSRNEVVMQPTFQVETPHTQTTTPHWISWQFDTQWEHNGGAAPSYVHYSGFSIPWAFNTDPGTKLAQWSDPPAGMYDNIYFQNGYVWGADTNLGHLCGILYTTPAVALTSNDMWASLRAVDDWTENGEFHGVAVRMSEAAVTFYGLWFDTDSYQIFKYVAGSKTVLATDAYAMSAGKTFRLEAEGTTLRAYVDGVLLDSATDADVSAGRTGIITIGSHTYNRSIDFRCGDLPVGDVRFANGYDANYIDGTFVTSTDFANAVVIDNVSDSGGTTAALSGAPIVTEFDFGETYYVSGVRSHGTTNDIYDWSDFDVYGKLLVGDAWTLMGEALDLDNDGVDGWKSADVTTPMYCRYVKIEIWDSLDGTNVGTEEIEFKR